jgi:hypothetical protein
MTFADSFSGQGCDGMSWSVKQHRVYSTSAATARLLKKGGADGLAY